MSVSARLDLGRPAGGGVSATVGEEPRQQRGCVATQRLRQHRPQGLGMARAVGQDGGEEGRTPSHALPARILVWLRRMQSKKGRSLGNNKEDDGTQQDKIKKPKK